MSLLLALISLSVGSAALYVLVASRFRSAPKYEALVHDLKRELFERR